MRLGTLRNLLSFALFTATCAAAGCTQPGLGGSDDPSASLIEGSADPKADGTGQDALNRGAQAVLDEDYPGGRAQLSQKGFIRVTAGSSYSETLTYAFPDTGVRIMDGFVDSDPTLGLADGEYTDIAMYAIHKPADQIGLLSVDTHGDQLALRVLYKVAGGTTQTLPYVNRDHPIDLGRTNVDVGYLILVAPGGTRSGTGTQTYKKLTIDIVNPG